VETETVCEGLARLRAEAPPGGIYFYVVDPVGRLVGVVPKRRLLLADPAALVGELMIYPAVSVEEQDRFGSALATLAENRLLALPVIDAQGRLTGVIDVSHETYTLFQMERRGRSYFSSGLWGRCQKWWRRILPFRITIGRDTARERP
jgi:hypothetical protein